MRKLAEMTFKVAYDWMFIALAIWLLDVSITLDLALMVVGLISGLSCLLWLIVLIQSYFGKEYS